MSLRRLASLPLAVCLTCLSLAAGAARAAVYVPTKTADGNDGACDADSTLREAEVAANAHSGEDVIQLHARTYALTLSGSEDLGASGDLDLLGDLVVIGDGADRSIVVGAATDRLLHVHGGATVELRDLALRNGRSAGAGGAVLNEDTLTIERCLLSGNRTSAASGDGGAIASVGASSQLTGGHSALVSNQAQARGGAIFIGGFATLRNVTIADNLAGTEGGGVYVTSAAHATLNNLTIADNEAVTRGGGLLAEITAFVGFAPRLDNTIVAQNNAPTGPDCAGDIDTGYSLIANGAGCNGPSAAHHDKVGIAARLDTLQNLGGTTPVMPLHVASGPPGLDFNSPAIDAGNPAPPGSGSGACETTDQRGATRPYGASCDMGAFELSEQCVTGGKTLCLVDSRFSVTAHWRTGTGDEGFGQAIQLTPDSGVFWFFGPDNIEITVKVLDACSFNHRFWVFASGTTNVEVVLSVIDTQERAVKTYTNPLGRPFVPIQDTSAFATCP
jgi:hypothetical protein